MAGVAQLPTIRKSLLTLNTSTYLLKYAPRAYCYLLEKRIKALSVHLFVNMKELKLEKGVQGCPWRCGQSRSCQSGASSKKQAPGPGGAVDACGSGYVLALFLILILYTHKHTHTLAHTHIRIHACRHTFPKEIEGCLHRKADVR